MRLIDADALRDILQALAYDDWNQGVTTSWADAYSEFADMVEEMPSAQEKPFNLPEIHIAEGYDTIEGEDGNVGFGVYIPDENQIYVAGNVEDEIRAKALLHEICHWVQDMCGRPFDEDEANSFAEVVYDALPSAQPTPCDVCRHNPPSSMDGKPCCVCPAEGRADERPD